MMNRYVVLLSFFLLSFSAFAQVSFGGRAWGLGGRAAQLPRVPEVTFPVVDAAALLAEDEARHVNGYKGPWRFGFNHDADVRSGRDGSWHTLPNGDRLWRVALHCPDAYAINFKFTTFELPEGALLYVYNEAGQQLGSFTRESSPGRTRMAVSQLPGDRVTIEYHEPAAVAGQGALVVGQVTHAYRDIFGSDRGFGDSGECNINVICPDADDWRDEIRTVAIITTGGNGFCTGTLMNNCAGDSIPYFLTAHHCLSADVEDWVFRFNWESPVCDPSENAPIDQTVAGCELLVDNVGTDMAFLRLSSIPPPAYNANWAGWDKRDIAPESGVGIHHPRGDIKKFSRTDGAMTQQNVDLGTGDADCWRVAVWDAGTTEPGSSGSAIWNQDHRVVGQLYGGAANCANSVDDYYGRFSTSWPFLEEYLGTCGDTLDGLNVPVVVPINWDASITSIFDLPALVCDEDSIRPWVTLKNNGELPITNVGINYAIAGLGTDLFIWNGLLQPGQTANVQLPWIPVTAGEYELVVNTTTPNGNEDQVPENDGWSRPFVVSTPGQLVRLDLTLDDYGTDITWELANDAGTVLYEGGPYADGDAGELVSTDFCLTNGCYVFTIADAFGDGICCAEGDGSYTIHAPDLLTFVESDGQYGEGEEQPFCLTEVSVPEVTATTLQLAPNPTKDRLVLRASEALHQVRMGLLDGAGRSVRSWQLPLVQGPIDLDLQGLAPGTYLLQLEHSGGRSVDRIVKF
ncbi:MAG: trypsin-like peptidase domain-containing protein [Flavobacteriales bacterium]